MKSEFKRFGIPQFRVLTGILQLIGGTGLIVGFFFAPIIAYLAALGLAVLMFMGFITRLKIKDGMLASTPALFFCPFKHLFNLFVCLKESNDKTNY
jgi:uncharacterized membrane protein YphA (DoxX/SURF4 family)